LCTVHPHGIQLRKLIGLIGIRELKRLTNGKLGEGGGLPKNEKSINNPMIGGSLIRPCRESDTSGWCNLSKVSVNGGFRCLKM